MACPQWQIFVTTTTTMSTAVPTQSPRGMANPYMGPALQVLIHMIFLKSTWGRNRHWHSTHFTDEEIETQSGWGTCPRSKTSGCGTGPGSKNSRRDDSSIHPHNHWNKPSLKGVVTGVPPLHVLLMVHWVPSIAPFTQPCTWLTYAHVCLPGRLQDSSSCLRHF